MLPRIFVGGTGRSGTWILYKTLGQHKDVHVFPAEMRFIIDPGGLMDLFDALTSRYAPVHARDAVLRFEKFMRVYGTTPGKAPYWSLDLPQWLGEKFYWNRLDQFLATVVEVEFETSFAQEQVYDGRLVRIARQIQQTYQPLFGNSDANDSAGFDQKSMPLAKYFANEDELLGLMATFVDDLFMNGAHLHGKQTWCEKTPQHLLHLDFIWRLFPDSVFIHIKRDPRGIVQSLTKQSWAPTDLRGAAYFLRNMYQRWLNSKPSLQLEQKKYLELKLEDLALHTTYCLEQVLELCDLEDRFIDVPDIDIARVDYWKHTMTPGEIELVNEILGEQIELMGYEL